MAGETLAGVESFAVGAYEQEDGSVRRYDEGYLAKVLQTFQRISTGQSPLHRVPVVVTHDDKAAYGWVRRAYASPVHQGGKLAPGFKTDWEEVSPALAAAIKARRFKKVSVEFKDDFRDNEGRSYGPVLWRVAVLGADVPKVKGLADIPTEFADRSGVSCFAEVTPMTIDEAKAFLTLKGIDPAMLDGADEAFVMAVADAWRTEEEGEGADTGPGGNGADTTGGGNMADETRTAAAVKKETVTRQFRDEALRVMRTALRKEVAPLQRQVRESQERLTALDRQTAERLAAEKRARIDATLTELVASKKVLPAELDAGDPKNPQPTLRDTLLALDATKITAFAEGQAPTSELDRALAALKRRPDLARFAHERVKAGTGGTTEDPELKELEERTKRRYARKN
jgi:hypothetical protein